MSINIKNLHFPLSFRTLNFSFKKYFTSSSLSFSNVNPYSLSSSSPHTISNLIDGNWRSTTEQYSVIDPMNGDPFIISPNTNVNEFHHFIDSLKKIPKSGRHNHFKCPERFMMYGEILHKTAAALYEEEIFEFFVKCIQRTMPKHYKQAAAEVKIVRKFCENFSGDSIRFLMRGFTVAGDHMGQHSHGYRWPYGGVAVISPFNFPFEIPAMQMLSAAMVGNKPLLKCHSSQGLVMEQFIRLLHSCGLPLDEIDLISTRGDRMYELLSSAPVQLLQFTGGSDTASKLINLMKGRIRIEDAGCDWKILASDVEDVEYVAWQCDQDAYAMSGQKCSATSILFAHKNWVEAGLYKMLEELSSRRSLDDLTCSPILSLKNEDIQQHIQSLLSIEGSRILFGGSPLPSSIPPCYGSFQPTAVYIPLNKISGDSKVFNIATQEVFGPLQIITEWVDEEEGELLHILNAMQQHLTAAVVTKDTHLIERIVGATTAGTTYVGRRARTTGAPVNHWFGQGGNPLGAGIGSPEAVLHTWTTHREIVYDNGPVPNNWRRPPVC